MWLGACRKTSHLFLTDYSSKKNSFQETYIAVQMYANKMPSNQQKGLSFFLTAGGSLACGVPDPKGWVPCTTECPPAENGWCVG